MCRLTKRLLVVLIATETILGCSKGYEAFVKGYEAGARRPEADVKTPEASLKFPERRKYRHADKIDVVYDRFRDETGLSINYPEGMKVRHTSFEIDFSFVFSGHSLAQPVDTSSKLSLEITSHSESWKYLEFGRDLVLLVDGERMSFGTLKHHGIVHDGYVIEFMTTSISVAQFLKLANAKSIEGQLSTTEFSLTNDQIETIKDFASRLSGGSVTGEIKSRKPS